MKKGQPLKWNISMDNVFYKIKILIAADMLSEIPGHNECESYTESSSYQIGACIMQGSWPVVYYSKKLYHAQQGGSYMEPPDIVIQNQQR